MKRAFFIALLAGVAALVYFQSFYPPVLYKRATRQALEQFEKAVGSKDRAQVAAALKEFLSEPAKLHLDVVFFSITQQNKPVPQDFDKASFIAFIDNILYSLADFSYEAKLEEFVLADDHQSADVVFTSKQWGDGESFYAGIKVNMRFSSNDTRCQGKVIFDEKTPRLDQVTCTITLMSVPKPGEAGKLRNIDAVQDMLRKQP